MLNLFWPNWALSSKCRIHYDKKTNLIYPLKHSIIVLHETSLFGHSSTSNINVILILTIHNVNFLAKIWFMQKICIISGNEIYRGMYDPQKIYFLFTYLVSFKILYKVNYNNMLCLILQIRNMEITLWLFSYLQIS